MQPAKAAHGAFLARPSWGPRKAGWLCGERRSSVVIELSCLHGSERYQSDLFVDLEHYMTFFSSTTDEEDLLSREIYSPSRNHANLQAQCCKINIENCLPQPSMDVRFEDILEFKSKRKDELNAFRAKIRELEINIYNADSPELIRHYETQFIEEWQQCSQDYYKALKDSKLAFFLSSLVSLVGIVML